MRWLLLIMIIPVLAAAAERPAVDPDALPDDVRVAGPGIEGAWLVYPTRRYDHAILGDAIEAGGVRVRLFDGRQLTYRLPLDSVFEDRYPRPVDVDGDGLAELILVRSYLQHGAALTVVKVTESGLQIMAESAPIGSPHRWLNPVGGGDFDGDGMIELAAVVTPHIGGLLTLYEIQGARLRPILQLPGFSNHRIGSRILDQSAVVDINDDGLVDLAVPSVDFQKLRLLTLKQGELREIRRIEHTSPIITALEMRDLDGDGDQDLVYGLEDGQQIELLLPEMDQ